MTLMKIDQAPTITKLRQCRPYLVHPDTKQIFGYYQVSVRWADGTRKVFGSEEEARAYVEQRPVNQAAVEAEIPKGFREAQAVRDSYLIEDEPFEEQSEYDVILTDAGANRVAVIKQIRAITGLALKESKELAVNLPSKVRTGVMQEEAQEIKTQLEEAGAKVEVQ
jgi:large subunit ribosomal protein L7/L12